MRTRQKVKIRKSTKYFYIICIMSLIIVLSSSLIQNLLKNNTIKKKEEIYSYTNEFNYNYDVNLINNKYIDQKTLQMNEVYVTDLIDNIHLNINYDYIGNKASDLEYDYKILGKLQAVYTKDGEEQKVWDKEEVLFDSETQKQMSDKISIQEPIELNLKDKNKLITDFEKEMNMTLKTTYMIILQVDVKTEIDDEPVVNQYTSAVSIDLGEKTTQIKGENNKDETSYVTKTKEENENINIVAISLDTILIIILLIGLKYITRNTVAINKIKNNYRKELNRMLRLCQDKIVKIKDKVDIKQENIVDVKDFGEIIKVSEELFKPILYWESKESTEAWFSVMSNEITYRFIFRNNG